MVEMKLVNSTSIASTLPSSEEVHREFGDGAGIGEFRHIRVAQLGGQIASGAADELRALAAGTNEDGVFLVQLRCIAEQGGVERTAKSLVRADEDDGAVSRVSLRFSVSGC